MKISFLGTVMISLVCFGVYWLHRLLIPPSTWFYSTILMTVFSPNYRLQICCPRSTTSVKLSNEHTGHMGQKSLHIQSPAWCHATPEKNGINIEETIPRGYPLRDKCLLRSSKADWHLSNQVIRWPVSRDHITGSSLQLIEVTCFTKVDRWPSAVFRLDRELTSG